MRFAPLAVALAAIAVQACKSSDQRSPSPSVAAETSSPEPVDASSSPPPAPASAARATLPAGPATVFSGSYKSTPSTLYVPPEWKVRWRPEEVDAGTGEGALTLALEPGGRVHGSVDGPLGPAGVEGYAKGGAVTAKISRRDPADHGFSGTLAATQSPGRIEGTMSLSLAAGGALRSATFVLIQGDAGASP